jgi:hypothetical protein
MHLEKTYDVTENIPMPVVSEINMNGELHLMVNPYSLYVGEFPCTEF